MQRKNFDFEDSSANIKEKWERASDSVYAFVKEMIESGRAEYDPKNGDLFTPVKEFYQAYVNWCEENDRKPEAQSTVTKRLETKFRITKDRKKIAGERVWCYTGIRLKKDESENSTGGGGNNDTPDCSAVLFIQF
jgi:phage/plasmid-associated DNA primase